MAVELKLARATYPTVARFAVQFKCFGKYPGCLTQQYKCSNNHPIIQKPKVAHCPISLPQTIKGLANCGGYTNQQKRYLSSFKNCTTVFRQLDCLSRPNEKPNLLGSNTNKLLYLKGLPKSFFFRHDKNDEEKKKPNRRIPKLILVQNPFTWLMIKLDFIVLRRIWDPSFQERDFKFGTKQAISKVTHVIRDGQYNDLNGLLTKAARLSLMRELDRNWSDKQRSLLALKQEDIQISSPRKVYFIRIADKRYCDVDMAFLALKWAPINSIDALIFTEIFARFHREYTPHSIPEWTIAYFKVTRFEVLRRKNKTQNNI